MGKLSKSKTEFVNEWLCTSNTQLHDQTQKQSYPEQKQQRYMYNCCMYIEMFIWQLTLLSNGVSPHAVHPDAPWSIIIDMIFVH